MICMSDTENIRGKRIREIRKARGWSSDKLAEKVGTAGAYIREIELGKRRPSLKMLEKIAQALGVSVAELLEEHEPDTENVFKPLSEITDWVKVPVYGEVPAGEFHLIEENIIDEISVPREWIRGIPEPEKNVGALIVRGDSMYPDFQEGDYVVLGRYPYVEISNGDDVVVSINGEITLKKFLKKNGGFILVPVNENYDQRVFDEKDLKEKHITIFKVLGFLRGMRKR